jgi:phosphate transport system substrate-binding protein
VPVSPPPLYTKWFKDYNAITPDALVDYQATSSGGGIHGFNNGLVDFVGSDHTMSDAEIADAPNGPSCRLSLSDKWYW